MVDRLAQLPRRQRACSSAPTASPRSSRASRRSRRCCARSAAQPPGLLELEVDGWHAVATPVATRADQAARWLVLASPRRGFIGKLAKPAAEATAPLLAAMARLSDVVRDQEQAVKAALLAEALEPAEARDPLPLAARAAAFGLDFSAARPARGHPARAATRRRRLGASGASSSPRSSSARVPHLAHQRDGLAHRARAGRRRRGRAALAPLADALPRRRDRDRPRRSRRSPTPTTRCATPSSPPTAAASTRSGASCASRTSTSATFVVSEIAPERLEPKVDEILSVLRANPPLHEALSAYFAHDLDIAATAASLHMHRNSLRYRLARAEQLLGRSLKQPATIAAVYIALVAEAGDQSRARDFGLTTVARARRRAVGSPVGMEGHRAADGAVPRRRRRLRVPRARRATTSPATRAGRAPTRACARRSASTGSRPTSRRTSTGSTSARRRRRTSAPSGSPPRRSARRARSSSPTARRRATTRCASRSRRSARGSSRSATRTRRSSTGSCSAAGCRASSRPSTTTSSASRTASRRRRSRRRCAAAPDAQAAFIVSPTYYGMAADVAGCAEVAHARRRAARRRPVVGPALRLQRGAAADRAVAGRRRDAHEHAQDRRLADAERDAARRPQRPRRRRRGRRARCGCCARPARRRC